MELKDYQVKVMERLDEFLNALREKQQEAEDFAEFQRSKGREARAEDYCPKAWDGLNERRVLPMMRDSHGARHVADWLARRDGLGREIPNVCFKVPTGGGKTLLAASALERINVDYFGRQTGFVLWVVPSDSIYKQTWRALSDREHPYRQVLERASGGRVRMMEKTDHFTSLDVQENLCLMLLMLQSSARRSKETLRVFKDSGNFTAFFPEVDDFPANEALVEKVPNLDVNDMADSLGPVTGLSIKQSLGNTLKLLRPIVIIDEGHKAYSPTALATLNGFNPRFVLELSATPNARQRLSNVLVDIPGTALKEEQMIKLPINVYNYGKADWKHTLAQAHGKLEELRRSGKRLQGEEGRYIRPILLVRVERTGKEQRDKANVHSEDAREYLIEKLGAKPEEIAVKSSEKDEIGEENLFSETCEIRYIITKSALQEGWDCSFAYVLALLDKTTARTALKQMIGRILRQPDARTTPVSELNECYVYCFDQDVVKAVDSIKAGLEEEGMADLGAEVRAQTASDGKAVRPVRVKRRKRWRGMSIFLPRVLRRVKAGQYRVLDYDRDILGAVDWSALKFTKKDDYAPGMDDKIDQTFAMIDMNKAADGATDLVELSESRRVAAEGDLDFGFLARQLMDVVPNPWEGTRILDETLEALRAKGATDAQLYVGRLALLKTMKSDLREQVDEQAENLFREGLEQGDIVFELVSAGDERLNWELREELEVWVSDEDKVLRRRNASDLERSLFEKVFEKEVNGLEREVAWYLDGKDAVRWWHRLVARQDYHLQGWQRNKIYPDFLICLERLAEGHARFALLETKGEHLKGNDDTEYKRKILELLSEHSKSAVRAGELELGIDDSRLTFKMLLEDTWQEEIAPIAG